LKERFGLLTPSVGAILRQQKAAGTPAGLRAAEYFDRGLLVPDEITIEIVRQWLAAHDGSWVLDGFPRTVVQARAFDAILCERNAPLDFAIFIHVDDDVVRDRVANRLICSNCGAILRAGLHVAGFSEACPRCGGTLERRADDSPEALADRLVEYRTKSEPVIAYYMERDILKTIDGNRPPETVFAEIAAAINTLAAA
jgi:adenylate kinase